MTTVIFLSIIKKIFFNYLLLKKTHARIAILYINT